MNLCIQDTMKACTKVCYFFLLILQEREAQFFRKIIDIQQLRVAPDYFMVGYYGKGFPLFLRVSPKKLLLGRGKSTKYLS